MRDAITAGAMLTFVVLLALSGLAGCRADPHDTHIATGVTAPR